MIAAGAFVWVVLPVVAGILFFNKRFHVVLVGGFSTVVKLPMAPGVYEGGSQRNRAVHTRYTTNQHSKRKRVDYFASQEIQHE